MGRQLQKTVSDFLDFLCVLTNHKLRSIIVTMSSGMKPDEILQLKTKMQAILFSIEDGIVMVDFKGNVLLLNDSAKKMLGILKRFPYDKKFLDYIMDESVRKILSSVLESEEETYPKELVVTKNQKRIFLKIKKNLVATAQEEILGRVLVLRDVTLEKELEEIREDFLHSITHDLKSPLTSVQGFLDLFLGRDLGSLTKKQTYCLKLINYSTKKLVGLVNNILDLAKLESGKMSLHKTEWDIQDGVDQIIKSFKEIAKKNKIKVAYSNSVKSLLFVDGVLLDRTITNLLDNALKFTPPGGKIEVGIEESSDKILISISNSGRGIPPEFLDKIFEKFGQVPGTKGGTGLGLTIAKYVVEAHGGEISVDSKLGRGATFRFWVPK